ncbi:MAG: hypothetical protein KatS3mg082_3027 [Nitrospiraceae bacterium]|nr:MAG: hypothetical protein KatS3mg015_1225 [Fimbriimonadales bacterium]GIW56623.1 MAG: hypothetical protein KatS3mg082_3027 [Nitrospiraceae bacterium]
MTSRERVVWQLAGGQASRSYADVFLKYGVALIGPGDWGPWSKEKYDGKSRWYDDDFAIDGFVRRFAEEVQVGDVFLLRTGISTICAVGIVASNYLYLTQFDDVSGRDLQHARRVRWQPLPEPYDFGKPVFGANPSRLSRVQSQEVLDYVNRFLNSPPTHWQTGALPDLPAEEAPLEDVPSALRNLVATANDLVPLLWDREAFGEQPSEREMVAHFVVPFLRALGWQPERIAVEWRRIDVALFDTLPRTPENCRFVIEVKRFGAGVEEAFEQAKGYVEDLGVDADIVVTDGIRYRMYTCSPEAASEGRRAFEPVAYANLSRLKRSAANLFARMKKP